MASVEQYSVLRTDIRNRHSDLAGAFDDDLCLEIADELKHTGTIFSSTINLCNTILGSGMLAMPYAISTAGILLGSCMIIFSGFTSAVGLYLLARCAEKVPGRKSSFFAVAGLTYPKAALLFDFAIALKCFGVSVSYLIIFGDLFPQVVLFFGVPPDSIVASRSLWITAALIGMVPLAFKKQLDSLKYVSFVALVAVVYLLYSVTDYYFDKEHRPQVPSDEIKFVNMNLNVIFTIPLYVFAFTCHQNIFSIYNELKDNSPRNVNKTIEFSIFTSATLYHWIGVLAYLTFGSKTVANILTLYPATLLFNCCKAAVAFFVVSAYPLQCHPARASIGRMIAGFQSPKQETSILMAPPSYSELADQPTLVSSPQSLENGTAFYGRLSENNTPNSSTSIRHDLSERAFTLITILLLLSSYFVAIMVQNLSLILAFVGSTGSTSISFILPGLLYYKLNENGHWDIRKILSVFLVFYGFGVMLLSLFVNVRSIFV